MGQLYHFLMGSSREKVGGSRTGNRTRFASFPLRKMQSSSPDLIRIRQHIRRIPHMGNRTRFAFSFPLGKMQSPSSHANLHLSANPEDTPCRQPDSICIFFPLGKENNGVVPVEPGTTGSPPDCRIQMGSSPVPVTSKKAPHSGCFFAGAGNRTRTGTLFTARDFKSLVSTDFTMPAWLLRRLY